MIEDQELQQDFIGAKLEITVVEDGAILDLSPATSTTFRLRKPNGEVIMRAAAFTTDGTDGMLRYFTIAGDLDHAGTWKIQAYVDFGGSPKGYGAVGSFRVKSNL